MKFVRQKGSGRGLLVAVLGLILFGVAMVLVAAFVVAQLLAPVQVLP